MRKLQRSQAAFRTDIQCWNKNFNSFYKTVHTAVFFQPRGITFIPWIQNTKTKASPLIHVCLNATVSTLRLMRAEMLRYERAVSLQNKPSEQKRKRKKETVSFTNDSLKHLHLIPKNKTNFIWWRQRVLRGPGKCSRLNVKQHQRELHNQIINWSDFFFCVHNWFW